LHAFETTEPRTTALVVIDLDEATVGTDDEWERIFGDVRPSGESIALLHARTG
jgi:hypothetical protein